MKKRTVKYFAWLLALIFVLQSQTIVFASGQSPPDIARHPDQAALQYALSQGYIHTFPDGMLRPNQPITRAQFALAMDRWLTSNAETLDLLGVNFRPHLSANFADVTIAHPFFAPIAAVYGRWLIDADLAYFHPDEPLTRGDFAASITSLYRVLTRNNASNAVFNNLRIEDTLSEFRDAAAILNTSQIADSRMAAAFVTEMGFLEADRAGRFFADGVVSRAQFAAVLVDMERDIRSALATAAPDRPAENVPDGLRITNIRTRNFTSDGFELEITVNRAAAMANPELLLAPSTIQGSIISSQDVERLNMFGDNPFRLSHMNVVVEHHDETVFSYRLSYEYLQNYSLFAMLRTPTAQSRVERAVVSFIGETGGGIDLGDMPGLFDDDIILYNINASAASDYAIEVRTLVNRGAVDRNANVYIAFTTDRNLIVNQNTITQSAGGLTSTMRPLNSMRDISPNNLINEFSTTVHVGGSGTYQVYVILRSGDLWSVIRHAEVVLGTGTNINDIAISYVTVRNLDVDRQNFAVEFGVNDAALEKRAQVTVTFGYVLISDVPEGFVVAPGDFQRDLRGVTTFPLNNATQVSTAPGRNIFTHPVSYLPEGDFHLFMFISAGGFNSNVVRHTERGIGEGPPPQVDLTGIEAAGIPPQATPLPGIPANSVAAADMLRETFRNIVLITSPQRTYAPLLAWTLYPAGAQFMPGEGAVNTFRWTATIPATVNIPANFNHPNLNREARQFTGLTVATNGAGELSVLESLSLELLEPPIFPRIVTDENQAIAYLMAPGNVPPVDAVIRTGNRVTGERWDIVSWAVNNRDGSAFNPDEGRANRFQWTVELRPGVVNTIPISLSGFQYITNWAPSTLVSVTAPHAPSVFAVMPNDFAHAVTLLVPPAAGATATLNVTPANAWQTPAVWSYDPTHVFNPAFGAPNTFRWTITPDLYAMGISQPPTPIALTGTVQVHNPATPSIQVTLTGITNLPNVDEIILNNDDHPNVQNLFASIRDYLASRWTARITTVEPLDLANSNVQISWTVVGAYDSRPGRTNTFRWDVRPNIPSFVTIPPGFSPALFGEVDVTNHGTPVDYTLVSIASPTDDFTLPSIMNEDGIRAMLPNTANIVTDPVATPQRTLPITWTRTAPSAFDSTSGGWNDFTWNVVTPLPDDILQPSPPAPPVPLTGSIRVSNPVIPPGPQIVDGISPWPPPTFGGFTPTAVSLNVNLVRFLLTGAGISTVDALVAGNLVGSVSLNWEPVGAFNAAHGQVNTWRWRINPSPPLPLGYALPTGVNEITGTVLVQNPLASPTDLSASALGVAFTEAAGFYQSHANDTQLVMALPLDELGLDLNRSGAQGTGAYEMLDGTRVPVAVYPLRLVWFEKIFGDGGELTGFSEQVWTRLDGTPIMRQREESGPIWVRIGNNDFYIPAFQAADSFLSGHGRLYIFIMDEAMAHIYLNHSDGAGGEISSVTFSIDGGEDYTFTLTR